MGVYNPESDANSRQLWVRGYSNSMCRDEVDKISLCNRGCVSALPCASPQRPCRGFAEVARNVTCATSVEACIKFRRTWAGFGPDRHTLAEKCGNCVQQARGSDFRAISERLSASRSGGETCSNDSQAFRRRLHVHRRAPLLAKVRNLRLHGCAMLGNSKASIPKRMCAWYLCCASVIGDVRIFRPRHRRSRMQRVRQPPPITSTLALSECAHRMDAVRASAIGEIKGSWTSCW